MSILHEGRYAEVISRLWLTKKGYQNLFQLDWIVQDSNGNYIAVEVKHQEIFEPPPFAGHGLPPWQIKRRLDFQKQKGIRCLLLILDKKSKEWYWQWLDILEVGKFFDTQGAKPRRIYPATNFNIEPPMEQQELIERITNASSNSKPTLMSPP